MMTKRAGGSSVILLLGVALAGGVAWWPIDLAAAAGAASSKVQSAAAEKTKRSKAPAVTLTASPSIVMTGESVSLSYSSINATSCTASGGWSGSRGTGGGALISDLRSTQTFTLTCTGKKGTVTQSVTVTVESPPNVPPTAVATAPSPGAYSSQTIMLDGRQSRDTDGQIVAYAWLQIAGPAVTLSDATTAQPSFFAPPVDGNVDLRFRLQVTDDGGADGSAEVSVSIVPAAVQLDAEVAGGAKFKVDDGPVRFVVNGASFNGSTVQPAALSWNSTVQGTLATGVTLAQIVDRTLVAGTHTLTLTADCGALGTVRRTFVLPVLPRMLPVTSFQDTPAAGFKALMPVVAVTYVPTLDGVNLDLTEANYAYRPPEWTTNKVADVLRYTTLLTTRAKYFLEERSRFRGYKNSAAMPYLGYRVVAHYVFYEPLKLTSRLNYVNQQMADLFDVMNRISGQKRVEQDGVKEVWLWTYFNEKIGLWESNMSSPTTGDISNSDQFAGDLPVYAKTYWVYGYNYHRSQAEAVHNHGHQLERMFSYVDQRYSGNAQLFWGKFVGMSDGGAPAGQPMTLGRCGWTHTPPNTNGNYDYRNQTLVDSDCEDWKPDGTGSKRPVNADYWKSLAYDWPDGSALQSDQKGETQFYLWWMQNMPGDGNSIPYGATTMQNWWKFVADWDGAISGGLRLYR